MGAARGGVEGPFESPWVRPGWHVAMCGSCRPLAAVPFRDMLARARWAGDHAAGTGHVVVLFDGPGGGGGG